MVPRMELRTPSTPDSAAQPVLLRIRDFIETRNWLLYKKSELARKLEQRCRSAVGTGTNEDGGPQSQPSSLPRRGEARACASRLGKDCVQARIAGKFQDDAGVGRSNKTHDLVVGDSTLMTEATLREIAYSLRRIARVRPLVTASLAAMNRSKSKLDRSAALISKAGSPGTRDRCHEPQGRADVEVFLDVLDDVGVKRPAARRSQEGGGSDHA